MSEVRARELFRALLAPDEAEHLEKWGYFKFVGSNGKRYLLKSNGDVFSGVGFWNGPGPRCWQMRGLYWGHDWLIQLWHPVSRNPPWKSNYNEEIPKWYDVPRADLALAAYLLILTDAERFEYFACKLNRFKETRRKTLEPIR